MKLDKIAETINEIEKRETDKENKTIEQINDLKKELDKVTADIEQTYISGDTKKGEQLVIEQASLKAKINYHETFLKKRKQLPVIDKEQANDLKINLDNELYKLFEEQKKKYEHLFKEIESISSVMEKAINQTMISGNTLNRLSRISGNTVIDSRVTVFNNHIRNIINQYNNHVSTYLDKEKE